ncbi:MAG: nucleotidyl transferase AbiEii/AbiGii toxin family protein [Pseudomonadota bacterium]
MDKFYADTVRLLLQVAPEIFANTIFAMKGGTAINLFLRDMPRLSVDIDVVYVPHLTLRDEALREIANELDGIAARLESSGLAVKRIAANDQGETKLLVSNEDALVKIEVNIVFRGTVMPIVRQPLCQRASDLFGVDLILPVLNSAELYGSKLVAAMDRQHPRDLFDAMQMLEQDGLSDATLECFVTYLAGHNRPIHEVLFGNDKDISLEYRDNFVGMTTEEVKLEQLLAVRKRLRTEIPQRLTMNQKRFLSGLSQAEPDWSLLTCPHAEELPALRWKLANLQTFQSKRPDDFNRQSAQLTALFGL